MKLPTKEEINIYNSLDEISACNHFLGKTLEEAEALFRENSAYYQEDLMWMGPIAFSFYLQAVVNYLQSNDSSGDDNLVSCLYEIIVFRSKEKEFYLATATVKAMSEYIINNYEKFNVDKSIYGVLKEKYKHFQSQLGSAN